MGQDSEIRIIDGYFEVVVRGHVGSAQYEALAARFLNDPRVDPESSGLLDLREAEVDVTFGDLSQFVDRLRDVPRNTRGRVAVVAPDPVAYGTSRMFATLQNLVTHLRVFTDYDEARAWSRAERVPLTA
jgi:hypothetical protein